MVDERFVWKPAVNWQRRANVFFWCVMVGVLVYSQIVT
jgi:hypothetical protein